MHATSNEKVEFRECSDSRLVKGKLLGRDSKKQYSTQSNFGVTGDLTSRAVLAEPAQPHVPKLRQFRDSFYTLNRIHRVYGYPRNSLYDAATTGELRVVSRGRTRYTTPEWVAAWWERLAQGGE